MANFWDNLGQQNSVNNNTLNQFQQFMKSGGANNLQNQMNQIQQMMGMMNCRSPKELAMKLAKQKGISEQDLNQMINMVQQMFGNK